MADVTGIQSKQDVTLYGIKTTGNVAGLEGLNNADNTKYDEVERVAGGKSNQQNEAQRLFDPHGIFVSV